MEQEKKRIISKFEVILTVLAVIMVGYLIMHKGGMHLVKQTETVELTDNPTSKKQYKKKEKSVEKRQQERDVEKMLRNLDGRKEGRDYNSNRLTSAMEVEEGSDSDESRFVDLLRNRYMQESSEEPSVEFLQLLKTSRNTYRAVRDLFADPNETPKSELETLVEDVSSLLQNETVANTIFQQIENQFNIPAEESAAFAKKGKAAVSDWADFVEEHKEK